MAPGRGLYEHNGLRCPFRTRQCKSSGPAGCRRRWPAAVAPLGTAAATRRPQRWPTLGAHGAVFPGVVPSSREHDREPPAARRPTRTAAVRRPSHSQRCLTTTDPITSLSGRRLLVTGASGFIGARLCRRAAEAGAFVHAVSRAPHQGSGDMRGGRGELPDEAAVRDLVRRVQPEVVVHLASEVGGSRDVALVLPMLRANLL